jgi:hypothetical protein
MRRRFRQYGAHQFEIPLNVARQHVAHEVDAAIHLEIWMKIESELTSEKRIRLRLDSSSSDRRHSRQTG